MRITPVPPHIIPPIHQADATLSQDNPVSGTQYTVLDTTRNVRLIYITASVTWTVQPSPMQIWVTIDGQTIEFQIANPVSATTYYAFIGYQTPASAINYIDTTAPVARAFLLEGRSVKVSVETTGGTVQNISCRVMYAKW